MGATDGGKLRPGGAVSSDPTPPGSFGPIDRGQRLDAEGQLEGILEKAAGPPAPPENLHPQPILPLEQPVDGAPGTIAPQRQVRRHVSVVQQATESLGHDPVRRRKAHDDLDAPTGTS